MFLFKDDKPNRQRGIRQVYLSCVLMTLLPMQLWAFSAYSQKINIEMRNMSLENLLLEIRNQAKVDFMFDRSIVSHARQMNVNIKGASTKEALNQALAETDLEYSIDNNMVVITRKNNRTHIQIPMHVTLQVDVSGTVTDIKGVPLANVNVQRYSNRTHAMSVVQTGNNGNYQLGGLGANDTLMFTAVGYEMRIVPIRGRKQVSVQLEEKIAEIEDVVVTGIFERKAESFTGSTVQIKGEDLRKVGSTNVFQSLKNISPSMFLDNFDMGSNPNSLPNMQIRGNGSLPTDMGDIGAGLKGNYLKDPTQPLFILDGFEASIERIFDLDINRIESLTILKDAASKAIYGSKAANGVIVIETLKMSGSKPFVTYNATTNIELPDLKSYNLTNAREKLQAEVLDGMYNVSGRLSSATEELIHLQKLYNKRLKLVEEGLDTYWLAKPLRNGVGQRHALSAELGTGDLRVMTDFTYNDVKGAMKGSDRRNVGGNVSASYRIKDFMFRNLASFTSNRSNESPYGTFSEYAIMNPYWRAVNPDGTIPYYAENNEELNVKVVNPLFNSTLNSKNQSTYNNFTNNLYIEWTPIKGLRATTRVGIDLKNSDADEFYPAKHTKFDEYLNKDQAKKGSYQVNNGKSTYLSGDLNVNYSKQIARNYFFGNLGYNVSERSFSERVYLAEGFPSDRLRDIMFAKSYALDARPTGVDGITRDMGFLAAFSYMWDDRLISDFTYRANASSQFGADKRWASFWSAGLGWNLHNEELIRNLNIVDQFRIRGSVGATGNQNFNTNASIATYRYTLDKFYNGFPGSQLFNMANPYLQWESSFDYNGGLDLKVWRVGLRFDYYQRFTKNLLADVTLPTSTGFEQVKDNLGKIKNTGIELQLNYMAWQRERDFVSLQFGIETNQNYIVELSNSMKAYNQRMDALAGDRKNAVPVKKYQDGMAMDAIWAVPSLGIDPASGDEIYVQQDGNTSHIWRASDMIMAGVARPKYQGTIGLQAEYQGVGISITARYLGGGQLYNQTLVDRVENVDMTYNVDKRVLTGRWTTPGQDVMFKKLGNYDYLNEIGQTVRTLEKTRATTRFVQNRRELDISSINVYYDFYKQSWLKAAKLERLRAAFNMNEVAKFSSIQIERGLSYPFARTVSFSLTATF